MYPKIALEKARERVESIAKIDDFEKTSTGRSVEGYRHIFVTHRKLCLRVADQERPDATVKQHVALFLAGRSIKWKNTHLQLVV